MLLFSHYKDFKMRKRLSRNELFKIVNYLNENWELLKTEKFARHALLEKIGAAAETEITWEVFARICKDLNKNPAEIVSVRKRNVVGHGTDRIRLLAGQVSALVSELQRCYDLLGEKFNVNGHVNQNVIRSIVGGKNLQVYREPNQPLVKSK